MSLISDIVLVGKLVLVSVGPKVRAMTVRVAFKVLSLTCSIVAPLACNMLVVLVKMPG